MLGLPLPRIRPPLRNTKREPSCHSTKPFDHNYSQNYLHIIQQALRHYASNSRSCTTDHQPTVACPKHCTRLPSTAITELHPRPNLARRNITIVFEQLVWTNALIGLPSKTTSTVDRAFNAPFGDPPVTPQISSFKTFAKRMRAPRWANFMICTFEESKWRKESDWKKEDDGVSCLKADEWSRIKSDADCWVSSSQADNGYEKNCQDPFIDIPFYCNIYGFSLYYWY